MEGQGEHRGCVQRTRTWLHGIKLEEDPKTGPNNENAGDNWRRFVTLIQAIWNHDDVPPQLLWMIVILIPKGGGDYLGIGHVSALSY